MSDPNDLKARRVEIVVHHRVSMQFMADVLTSIAETSPDTTGWFGDEETVIKRIAEGEDWLEPNSVISITGRYDRKEDAEGGRGGKATLDFPAIQQGLQRALGDANISDTVRGYILSAVAEDDAGYIDADAADVIAQLAIFGEVIYG